jgi:hypothetical protein
MRIINSDEATIDDAFEVAQLMIEEGNTGCNCCVPPRLLSFGRRAIEPSVL